MKSLLHSRYYTKRVASGGAHLRGLTPGLRSSEETSQRWRAVGDTVYDLTGAEIKTRTSSPIAMSLPQRQSFYSVLI